MGIIEKCVSEFVFVKTAHWRFNEITLSGKKIFVLSEINGKASLRDISKKLNITLADLKPIINELGKLNLISIQTETTPVYPGKTPATLSPALQQPGDDKTPYVPRTKLHQENLNSKGTGLYRGISYNIG
jgi:hypothetical protein